ncbi:ADP-ribosylglycohydrolase [Seminavis robusta]|uniref:ADP-ribosylglycohydrolase n=1 Tax=Seminavis robusta TaxID=568900 RepID=A0A9N8H3P9_9STRA|nr:ADP-ribosylglycohydrolase [Seminavis robusta]|eukprot:Sro31_g020260.1 ADP-ribosylglycohydrolase (706) ;mRNA; r:75671-77788
MHERHMTKHNGSKNNQIGNSTHHADLRQRAPLNLKRDESSGPLLSSSGLPPAPISSGRPTARTNSVTSSKILDALAHPAQAAAVAAAASNQPVRGRKRKTFSLILMTVMCGAVVYYSGTLYDVDYVDEYFSQDGRKSQRSRRRRAKLRNRQSGRSENDSKAAEQQREEQQENEDEDSSVSSSLTRFIIIPEQEQQDQQQQATEITKEEKTMTAAQSQLLRDRIVSTIKAAFVADAASMGTHWIYKTDVLNKLLVSKDKPEFHNPPAPNFYSEREFPGHYSQGQASPYGEQLLFVTQFAAHLVTDDDMQQHEQLPPMDFNHVVSEVDDDDGTSQSTDPESILGPMSEAMQEWLQSFGGRADHASLQFLSCRQERLQNEEAQQQHADENDDVSSCGANDDQAHFFLKIVPLTCLYVGHPRRRHYVEQAIRVHQNNEKAVMFGLTLSDLLERVLLMDDKNSNNSSGSSDHSSLASLFTNEKYQSATSLREALDITLTNAQEEHSDSWFHHLADSFTQEHQQQQALLEAWINAKQLAQQQKSSEQVAGLFGRSCHMPGALVVSLHGLYRAAANAEAEDNKKTPVPVTTPQQPTTSNEQSNGSLRGYGYYFKALWGSLQATTDATTKAATSTSGHHDTQVVENTQFTSVIRENILAAGDTCSRAILMGAILGAAYGPPPVEWWQQLYPVLSGQVEEAAYTIADFAVRDRR